MTRRKAADVLRAKFRDTGESIPFTDTQITNESVWTMPRSEE